MRQFDLRELLRALLSSAVMLALSGCAQSPASASAEPAAEDPEPNAEAEGCVELPPALGRELDRPLTISLCGFGLDPPELDLAARERTIAAIHELGLDDPHSLRLAIEVASSELAAANWDGLDDPAVHERLRSTIALLESILAHEAQARSSIRDEGIAALMCAHAVLGENELASARGQELLNGYSGVWLPMVLLTFAEIVDDRDAAIRLYERVLMFKDSPVLGYAQYRLAWALRHPEVVDQDRAIELLEGALAWRHNANYPRIERAIHHRAAVELRALGRDVEVPARECRRLTPTSSSRDPSAATRR